MKLKNRIDDLAIFGGAPIFGEGLHVGRPNLGDNGAFLRRVSRILDKKWLTNNGPYVQEFEERIAKMIGVKHCIALCNGTVALEIAVRASGMKGEVIVPSLTFIATAHALHWQGITPIFCDINPMTYTLDPNQVERLISSRTTGIMGVHLWGRACDVQKLSEIARRHNLKLIFDAAHALGCSSQGRMIGNFGDAEIFSFHATKVCNTLEGGAVVTNNNPLAEKIRLMRNFGFAGYDNVVCEGTNGKMNEVSAAMGLTSLESLDQFISINQRNYKSYQKELAGIAGIQLLLHDETERSNYHYVVIKINAARAGISRNQLHDILWRENILSRRYFYPGCHRMEPYQTLFPEASKRLKVTEQLLEQVLSLPTGAALAEEDVVNVCHIIRFAVSHHDEIERRFQQKPVSIR